VDFGAAVRVCRAVSPSLPVRGRGWSSVAALASRACELQFGYLTGTLPCAPKKNIAGQVVGSGPGVVDLAPGPPDTFQSDRGRSRNPYRARLKGETYTRQTNRA
jgi:hypothetical protein